MRERTPEDDPTRPGRVSPWRSWVEEGTLYFVRLSAERRLERRRAVTVALVAREPLVIGAALAIAATCALACSGGVPDAPAEELGRITPPAAITFDEPPAASDEDDATCRPRTKRECMQVVRTAEGLAIVCRESFEYCRADGTGYHPCGHFGVGDRGEPVAPD